MADTLKSDAVQITVNPYLAKDSYFLTGDFNSWDAVNAWEMNRNLDKLEYEQYVYLKAWQGMKVLLKLGSWDGNLGSDGAHAGFMVSPGDNLTVSANGYYRMKFDMSNLSWSATATTWGIVGDVTGGWTIDVPMTFDITSQTWSVTASFSAGSFKFWANKGWDYNFGSAAGDGKLQAGAANLSLATAGTYTISMCLKQYPYTYTIVKK
jgi:hypothetical protein